MDSLGRNITLPIYNADGTSFHGLELKKFTFDSVVMALGDKITGELYYTTNTLTVAQTEYVVYDGVKYYLINPPTIVKEGMKADNGTAKGMTKYSFTFYHPMFMLYNFPFTDVAVTSSEEKYKSQDKNFFWIGNLVDYVAKLNKNLQGTEWVVEIGSNVPVQDKNKLSEVLSFNDQKIADALKTGYDTWEIPYIIDIIASTDSRYAQGKRFLIRYGLPSQEILVENAQHQLVPYVFQMGQGVGLKNDSRTPKNNKIVTRIAGYGSEDNVPFGYPQILWTGNQTWNYTINNSASAPNSYPIYDGIVAGQRVRLIHHPFTRSHLMPTIYADTVNKKVNPYASGYDPTIEIKDYYDAVNDSSWTYPNQITPYAPSYEIHEFSDIKPELGEKHIISAAAFDGDAEKKYLTLSEGLDQLMKLSSETNIDVERGVIRLIHDKVESGTSGSGHQEDIRYVFKWSVDVTTDFIYVKFASSNINFEMEIHRTNSFPSAPWDDAMDDDGNYKQSYFNITLPQLDFDLYACAAVTQEMTINMRSGACLGCSFPVEVDWEDYKANFYDSDGNFAPTGSQRDYNKYPDSSAGSITIICKKEIDTFGTLMPNIYQQPKANDKFVILGISLPTSYITNAQLRLDHDMCQYMLDNNVHYFEWPLKFDEFFLANHTNILAQMKPNILVRFNFASEQHELYIKQISVKYGEKPLPQYNITLTDDIEIVLSPIGRVTDEVSSLRVLFGGGGSGSGDINLDLLSEYFLSKQNDDTAAGMIRFLRGLQVGENFVTGLLGEGGIFRVDDDGTTYIEADKLYIRMRAYFDTVEVKKYLHSGGNRIASKAGINCSRVEWIDANGDVTNVLEDTVKFRCYFRANGENGREITNDFVVNDLAFCKETNVDNTSIQQHGYWRCVIGVSSSPNEAGEHWIDLSKSDCQSGSNIPLAQDDIIQLGHKTDNTRQGAIVEFVGGEDAPSYQIYQGINSYDLTGKNYVRFGYDSQNHSAQAYIGNPDGSTYLWYHYVTEGGHTTPRLDIKANVQFTSPESSYGTQDLNAFISAVTGDINNIHSQIDGQIESWFYDYMPVREESGAPADTVPLTNKEPYKSWYQTDHGGTASEVTTERIKHLGDTFYDNTSGYAFRFSNTGTEQSPVFAWVVIQDSAVIKALADAAKAQDTADHKRRAFVLPITIGSTTYNYPYPPYDVGDLWLNAKYPYNYDGATDAENDKYNNDVLRCITPQGENGSFSIDHWVLASKYTDDTELRNFLGDYEGTAEDLKQQIDKKAETWYQDEDPSLDWYVVNPQTHEVITDIRSEHVGDLWYCTAPVSATPPAYYDATHGGNKTWQYKYNVSEDRYYWAYQNVPMAVFDRIDGKAQLFVQIPNVANPKDDNYCYRKDDMWILESDNIHSPEMAGELMVATQSSTSYDPDHWVKKLKYTDDLNDFKANQYVQDLTTGTISTGITNAQNSADAAQDAADAAQLDATAAKNRLDNWADDGKISPTEKTALKQQWEDVKKEYLQICADATRYNVSTTNFDTAYTNANNAFTKYTASTPENIAIDADYANIAAYYSARQTILDSIASAAKTYAGGYYSDTVLSAIKTALGSALGASTLIDGGLMLTSMMFLRQLRKSGGVPLDPSVVSNYTTWAGVSGEYNDKTEGQTGWAKGNGIAAWYGGDMIDFEMLNATQQAAGWGTGTNQYRYAKTLFRMDGTGYLAGGNIKWGSDGSGSVAGGNLAWNAAGNITYINGQAVQVNGSDVLTAAALADYLPLSAGSTKALTGDLYISNNKFIKWLDSTNAAKTVLGLNDSNTLTLGYDTASAEYGTGIYGNTITFGYGASRTTGIYLNASGNVGIGTGSPSVKLDVNGYTKTTRLYLYKPNSNDTGAVYIEYDSTNSGMHLVGAGFYSDSYVSALGQGSGGGGGGISLNEPLLSINQAGMSAPTYNGSVLVYSSGWKYSYNAAIVTSGLTSTGSVSANGFYATGKDDTYVLLAGGGTKLLSEIGGTGSVVSVSINGTSYSPDANGDVNLGTGYLTGYTDTKNTAGGDDTSSKIFLVGMTAQTTNNGNARTYTQDTAYVGTDGCLYSNSSKVLTSISSSDVTTALGFTPAASSDLANYVTLSTAQTISGTKTMTKGLIVSGRAYNNGDDEGIVISGSSNGLAALTLGIHNGRRTVLYHHVTSGNPFIRYNDGTNMYNATIQAKNGTIALTSDIPTDISSFNNDSGYITSASLDDYVAKSGSMMTGQLTVKAPIFGYVFSDANKKDNAAFVFDKPSSHQTGIGAHGENDTIFFGACDSNGVWKTTYKQIWKFNGSIIADSATINGNAVITAGNITTQSVDALYRENTIATASDLESFHEANKLKYGRISGVNVINNHTTWILIDGCWSSSTFGFQLAIDDDPTYAMALRQRDGSGWAAWKQIPMGDGTGASGTWAIDISGNAATATSATSATNAGNADTVDSYHATMGDNKPFGKIPVIHTSGWIDIGKSIEMHYDNTTGSDFSTALRCTGNYSNVVYLPSGGGTLALLTDNVASATKLETSHTIWGQSFDGTDNITGTIYLNENNPHYFRSPTNGTWRGGMFWDTAGNEHCCFLVKDTRTRFVFVTGSDIASWANGTFNNSITSADMIIGSEGVGVGTKSPAYKLDVVGTGQFGENSTYKVLIGSTSSNAIISMKDSGGVSRGIFNLGSSNILYIGGGTANAGYQTTIRGNKILFTYGTADTNYAMFISATGKVMIGSGSAASYALHVTGDVYATGGVTALSDAREKNVIGSTNLTVEDIAMMKAVNYRWKDGRDNVQHVGSIAQDWQRVLPEVVMRADDEKGTLSLQYGVAALVSSIVTARKVVDHERRIAELERENRELKEKLKIA